MYKIYTNWAGKQMSQMWLTEAYKGCSTKHRQLEALKKVWDTLFKILAQAVAYQTAYS